MVFGRRHDRFSYSRGHRGMSAPFSYSPVMWPQGRSGASSRIKGFLEGEDAGKKQALMIGGAILGVVAVGALVYMAAKKRY